MAPGALTARNPLWAAHRKQWASRPASATRGCCTKPFKCHTNARSSTRLAPTARKWRGWTNMTSESDDGSVETDSCKSLLWTLPIGRFVIPSPED